MVIRDKILFLGAGGHGLVLADIAKKIGYKEIKFLDDQANKYFTYEIIGRLNDFSKYQESYDLFVSIGNNKVREKITKRLKQKNCHQVNLIHPSSVLSESVSIAEGICIMPNVVINAQSQIGTGCILNTSSSIDHEAVIKDFVHISPGCHLSGQVTIGERCWLGTGCNIINNITICDNCIIGAGATIIKNIDTSGTYISMPLRRIK